MDTVMLQAHVRQMDILCRQTARCEATYVVLLDVDDMAMLGGSAAMAT
jgi:hypothetical protein